jgi:hypothetical protein
MIFVVGTFKCKFDSSFHHSPPFGDHHQMWSQCHYCDLDSVRFPLEPPIPHCRDFDCVHIFLRPVFRS